jgi:glutaconate CoA-transferase subunit B
MMGVKMNKPKFTLKELLIIQIAREIRDGDIVIIGQGLPIMAGCLAKKTHAPNAILATEAGMLDYVPHIAPLHIADPTCTRGYTYSTDLFDQFTVLCYHGFVDVAVLGAAQIDKYGNINSTVIGSYLNMDKKDIRLPGAGGAPDFAAYAKKVIITLLGGEFVQKLDYFTSPGYLTGGTSRDDTHAFIPGTGPSVVITTQAVFKFDDKTKELYLDAVYPGVKVDDVKAKVPWDLKIAEHLREIPLPTQEEIEFLRNFSPQGTASNHVNMEILAAAVKAFTEGGHEFKRKKLALEQKAAQQKELAQAQQADPAKPAGGKEPANAPQ